MKTTRIVLETIGLMLILYLFDANNKQAETIHSQENNWRQVDTLKTDTGYTVKSCEWVCNERVVVYPSGF